MTINLDRLTSLAKKRVRQRVATPVIIKAKPNMLHEVADYVFPFHKQALEIFDNFIQQFPVFGFFNTLRTFNMVTAYLDRDTIYELADSRAVEKIFSDEIMFALYYPTVPKSGVFSIETDKRLKEFTSTYWTKKLVGADVANQKGYTGYGITVAVIDTGAPRLHKQLPQVTFDTVMPAQHVDGNGHGSWCATCIAGINVVDEYLSMRVGQDVYCEGMAPDVNLVAIKALGYGVGTGATSQILAAIEKAINDYNADVISMSLGGEDLESSPEDDPYYTAFQQAVANGTIIVVANGNSGPNEGTVNSPGYLPQALSVGAYDPIKGEIADFSSRGPTPWGEIKPDVVAPGVNIDSGSVGVLDLTTDKMPSGFAVLSGTSMATPHVAGLVALMKQAMRDLTGYELTTNEIKRMMAELGHPKNNTDGWGPITWQMFEQWLQTEYNVTI